jgi:hypothetical protein
MRRTALLVAMALTFAACGTESLRTADSGGSGSSLTSTSPQVEPVAGDGVLDCGSGQVARGADVRESADTEHAVVAAALAQWTDAGGSLVELPADESWSVVVDGRDVAVAYPEVEGTGAWVVQSVQVCGEPETEAALIDGELDCINDDTEFSMQGSVPPDATGPPTPEEELRMFLSQWRNEYGGEIVVVGETTGSLVVDGREQVVAHASPAPAGGWNVLTTLFCESFRL